jgi:hypothetical protein
MVSWPVVIEQDPLIEPRRAGHRAFVGLGWCSETLADALVGVWRRRTEPGDDYRCQATLLELFMFVCDPGDPHNHYSRTGIPRTHAGWEMQLIVDDGLLYYVYERCCAALRDCRDEASREGPGLWAERCRRDEASREGPGLWAERCRRDEASLRAAVAQLHGWLDAEDPEHLRARLRSHYAATIVEFVAHQRRFEPHGRELLTAYFECLIIHAYLRLAAAAPGSTIGFDLFPAHTGPDNVTQGLRGLINFGEVSHRGARRFYCCRAETYTRYYGRNLARALADQAALRFGLVVPHANCVRHIAMTRCWPIDGAENIARHVERVSSTWAEYVVAHGPRERPPTILVCGYSQGGAAVRLFDDALAGIDVLGHPYFRASAPRWYAPRCRVLARLIASAGSRAWAGRTGPTLHTVSIATMGGIDGAAVAKLDGARGVTGVLAHANSRGGLHLGICHDHDPARFIVPGPLRPNAGARSIVRVLLEFGGPAQVLHGGTWTAGAHQAFAEVPSAMALIDEVDRLRVSERFVDESAYFDERCAGQAFTHMVVGTYGYPGWTVVETFTRALARLGAPERELLREPSWAYDILPRAHDYVAIAGSRAAARRHLLAGHTRTT